MAKNVSKDRCPNCEFLWEAPDGTKVFATRLGEHARANFFMNAFLAITTDKDYNSNEYFMQLGKDGRSITKQTAKVSGKIISSFRTMERFMKTV